MPDLAASELVQLRPHRAANNSGAQCEFLKRNILADTVECRFGDQLEPVSGAQILLWQICVVPRQQRRI